MSDSGRDDTIAAGSGAAGSGAAGSASGHDNKTLATKAATGLVNFFDTLAAEALTWNTESDAGADYKDSVYVVATIV